MLFHMKVITTKIYSIPPARGEKKETGKVASTALLLFLIKQGCKCWRLLAF